MSFFRLLVKQVFNRFTVDAPLSGQALETGNKRQQFAQDEGRNAGVSVASTTSG